MWMLRNNTWTWLYAIKHIHIRKFPIQQHPLGTPYTHPHTHTSVHTEYTTIFGQFEGFEAILYVL